MKNIFKTVLTISLAVFMLLSAVSCGDKAPDMEKLSPELEDLGATVDGDTVILSHDSAEKQADQWRYLNESFSESEHLRIQATGHACGLTIVANHTEFCYMYLCALNDEQRQGGIPVAIPKTLIKEFLNQNFPNEVRIPEDAVVLVTGTLEMYEKFSGISTWRAPVLMLTSMELTQIPATV